MLQISGAAMHGFPHSCASCETGFEYWDQTFEDRVARPRSVMEPQSAAVPDGRDGVGPALLQPSQIKDAVGSRSNWKERPPHGDR